MCNDVITIRDFIIWTARAIVVTETTVTDMRHYLWIDNGKKGGSCEIFGSSLSLIVNLIVLSIKLDQAR